MYFFVCLQTVLFLRINRHKVKGNYLCLLFALTNVGERNIYKPVVSSLFLFCFYLISILLTFITSAKEVMFLPVFVCLLAK